MPEPVRQIRMRTAVVLLGALLLAILSVAGFTLRLLADQHVMFGRMIRQSREQALAQLGGRIEQTLQNAVLAPFHGPTDWPMRGTSAAPAQDLRAWPEAEEILLLDPDLQLRRRIPATRAGETREVDRWLAEKLRIERAAIVTEPSPPYTFIEPVHGVDKLFAVRREDRAGVDSGWVLIRYDLATLLARHVQPLLDAFNRQPPGGARLLDAYTEWDERKVYYPLNHILTGWVLVLDHDSAADNTAISGSSAVVLGIAGAVLLAMMMATFAVWRELRRERALAELRDRFVANVSHELKTPLALIRMYAETLYLRRITAEDRTHEYLRTILRESERLTGMIDNVLDFASLRRGVPLYRLSTTDLRTTVAEALDRYRPRIAEQGLALQVELDTGLAPVPHDPNGVTQILVNLLDNAAKYAAGGGAVTVRLRSVRDRVELQVIDRGPGIVPSERANVRRAFAQGHTGDSARGSGLGLALVEQIAAQHGAHVLLDSGEDGVGLKVVVSFPAGGEHA